MTVHDKIASASTVPQPYRYTQHDVAVLSRSGAFMRHAKTELMDGVIYTVNAQYSRHARIQTMVLRALGDACEALGGDLGAWVEVSIDITDEMMPQPDIVIVHGLPDDGPVPAAQVRLIVEVADTSLAFDLNEKASIYAAAGIPEYWVADVTGRVIHQLWSLSGSGYAERREIAFGQALGSTSIAGLAIDTARL